LPFEDAALPLQDILDAIAAIEEFTRGTTLEAFERDAKTEAAVERKLQIVSEAAIRLGDRAETLCPGLPWPNIRGIGNWLRHEYHRVDSLTIWKTVTDGLPPLKASVTKALKALSEASKLLKATDRGLA
jgi:uncharacterized protein with HEPN domain